MSDPDKDDVATPQADRDLQGKDASPDDSAVESAGPDDAGEQAPEMKDASPLPDSDRAGAPAKRGGTGIAWLALIVSLLVAAGVGWLLYENWQARQTAADLENPIAALTSRVATSEQLLSTLDRDIAELSETQRAIATELAQIETRIDDRVEPFRTIPQRMSSLENSVASLQGISSGARERWLLAEAEYYMQIANAQLQLAGNPQLAALALGMADERVNQIADPGLTDVRRAIADELAALDVIEKPDIEGVSLTLASLARVVTTLPLERVDSSRSESPAETESESTGLRRAWGSVKSAMSGLVRVTPPDQSEMPLVAPDAIYYLRGNLTLQLQAARLALLKGEQAAFEQSLDDARTWLEEYFDTGSAQVQGALETIAEIRANEYSVTPPDISGSLRLLRQFRLLSETGG